MTWSHVKNSKVARKVISLASFLYDKAGVNASKGKKPFTADDAESANSESGSVFVKDERLLGCQEKVLNMKKIVQDFVGNKDNRFSKYHTLKGEEIGDDSTGEAEFEIYAYDEPCELLKKDSPARSNKQYCTAARLHNWDNNDDTDNNEDDAYSYFGGVNDDLVAVHQFSEELNISNDNGSISDYSTEDDYDGESDDKYEFDYYEGNDTEESDSTYESYCSMRIDDVPTQDHESVCLNISNALDGMPDEQEDTLSISQSDAETAPESDTETANASDVETADTTDTLSVLESDAESARSSELDTGTTDIIDSDKEKEICKFRIQVEKIIKRLIPGEFDKVGIIMSKFEGREYALVQTLLSMEAQGLIQKGNKKPIINTRRRNNVDSTITRTRRDTIELFQDTASQNDIRSLNNGHRKNIYSTTATPGIRGAIAIAQASTTPLN